MSDRVLMRCAEDFGVSSIDSTSFPHLSPKWKGINPQILLDVYTVHKCHLFTFQQMTDYPLSEFIENVSKSDDAIFGNNGISDYVESEEFKDRASGLSLYPSWLINDDLFSVISIFHGLSDFARILKSQRLSPSNITIRGYVVPQAVVSLYDHSRHFEVDIPSIEEYIIGKGVQRFQRREIETVNNSATYFVKVIQESHDRLQDDEDSSVIVLIDRRNTKFHEIFVFGCEDWSAFPELRRNHLIGFDIEIKGNTVDDGGEVVRAYLNYGTRQMIRFYPEFMVSVVPKLFVRSSELTEYERISKLYSAEYKHGWNINLDEEIFNKIYKAITGYNHETNNYYRSRETVKKQQDHFLDFMERQYFNKHGDSGLTNLHFHLQQNGYDSDAMIQDVLSEDLPNDEPSNIGEFLRNDGRSVFEWDTVRDEVFRWEQSQCGSPFMKDFTECVRIQRLIVNLRKFGNINYVINEVTMKRFNLGELIRDFDHLVSVHKMFSGNDTVHIRQYMMERVRCKEKGQCVVVDQFRTRRRENEDMKPKVVSPECTVLVDTLTALHSYLLHHSDELYRLSSETEQSESRYSSLVQGGGSKGDEKGKATERAPLSIDFGVSVLQWLSHGERPTFQSLREEMVHNKDSTVGQWSFDLMEIECIEKMKKGTFSDYTLSELMGLKFYSDFTKMCTKLRRAHWKTAPHEVRKRYYHWARSIYLAALRHAKPIPIENAVSGAKTLYHGLSELFQMNVESPTYYGPFSTTLSTHASDAFSKKKGLRWNIQSGYDDSMTRCVGIEMKSISCFKHEQELLLVDQPIPIKGTKTWESDDDHLIDHFLFSLKSRSNPIRDRNLFFKVLGIKFKEKWMEKIAKHELLFTESEYEEKLVIWRLIHELKVMKKLSDCSVYNAARVLLTENLVIASNGAIILKQNGEFIDENGMIISFVARDSITNNGNMLSESVDGKGRSGGICIKTGKEMVNNGRIICDDDGVIVVWCTEFVNRGEITPIPMIQIMDNRVCGQYIDLSLKHIESDTVNFRADTAEINGIRMELDVVDHRGHGYDYHPRNLLVSGTGSYYNSGYDHGPPNEDWITFKQQTEPPLIATRIGIRNKDYDDSAIYRISIECSVDGTEFEEWIEIKGIEQGEEGKSKLQIFDVDLERIHYAMDKKWRFYKLRLLENYGDEDSNIFYEFILFGFME